MVALPCFSQQAPGAHAELTREAGQDLGRVHQPRHANEGEALSLPRREVEVLMERSERALELVTPETVTLEPEGGRLELRHACRVAARRSGVELAEMAWRTAMLNLRAASVNPPHRRPQGFYEGPWHDDFDASRMLLLPSLARGCTVTGEHLVFAPTVGRTWVVGSDDVAAMTAVLDAIDAHLADEKASSPYQYRQLLFGWPWVVSGETVRRWSVPASHPLAGRIAALDAALQKRREASSQHIGGFARGVYSPLSQQKPGEA